MAASTPEESLKRPKESDVTINGMIFHYLCFWGWQKFGKNIIEKAYDFQKKKKLISCPITRK